MPSKLLPKDNIVKQASGSLVRATVTAYVHISYSLLKLLHRERKTRKETCFSFIIFIFVQIDYYCLFTA